MGSKRISGRAAEEKLFCYKSKSYGASEKASLKRKRVKQKSGPGRKQLKAALKILSKSSFISVVKIIPIMLHKIINCSSLEE